jgi:hypothetical protein
MFGMRTSLAHVFIALILLTPASARSQKTDGVIPEGERGSALYRECKVAIKVGDEGVDHMTNDEVDTATKCLRYFQGMTEALTIAEPSTHICLGPHTTMGTVMHVYVRFMETHPKYLDEDAGMAHTWRCWSPTPAKNKSSEFL